jgi:hypothetical protein
MKAFSDGVFAIAATLLVLDLAVEPPGMLPQVLHAWPGYVAYLISFLTIGGAWLAHTALTERLTRSPVLRTAARRSSQNKRHRAASVKPPTARRGSTAGVSTRLRLLCSQPGHREES